MDTPVEECGSGYFKGTCSLDTPEIMGSYTDYTKTEWSTPSDC